MKDEGRRALDGLFGYPKTRLGLWSIYLAGAFVVVFAAWFCYISSVEIYRPTFFSDPLHAVLILSAAISSIAGAIIGLVGVVWRTERSILTMLSVLLGAFVLYWAAAEISTY